MMLFALASFVAQHPLDLSRLAPPAPAAPPAIQRDFGKLPLSFVPNAGQTNPAVRFQVRGMGGTLFFTPKEVVLSLPTASPQTKRNERRNVLDSLPDSRRRAEAEPDAVSPPAVVRLTFDGANPTPEIAGAERLPGIANYLIGNDPAKWRTNVPTYAGVVYKGLYPGVDLRYDGTEGQMKGTYTVAPGADPTRIRWRYSGADSVRVDEATGDLHITPRGNPGSTLVERAPVAWQTIADRRVSVPVTYAVAPDGAIAFSIGSYDPAALLTLDPTLAYSTYLGGSDNDWGYGIAVDEQGNAYVTGQTYSTDFPTANAFQRSLAGSADTFVAKLTATGSLAYSTYLGGSDYDWGQDITVDGQGNAYITGWTYSLDFPTANAFQRSYAGNTDAFVAKLGATGNVVYSTYLGGSNGDEGQGIAVDGQGNAYITGWTGSADFPTTNAFQSNYAGSLDTFVAKLTATGLLAYSTYLGGSADDRGLGITVDGQGNAYITGLTSSADFPTTNAFQRSYAGSPDTFVAKLTATGGLAYSAYLGGSGYDYGAGIAVDGQGNAYITGGTRSTDFPTANAFQRSLGGGWDAFVAKLSATGLLAYSTYLGGSADDQGLGITVDGQGNAYITGWTGSADFPTTNAFQSNYAGGYEDAFVAKLTATGSLAYSTYLGGSKGDEGQGITVDGQGNAYITGWTYSLDFPIANAFQRSYAGGYDTFVTKISPTDSIRGTVHDGNGAPLQGVAISDGRGHVIVTDSTGAYTLSGLTKGTYVLTASKAGYTFTPSSLTVALPPSAVSQNFVGMTSQPPTYTITGRVRDPGGNPVVNVGISGSGRTTFTDANGDYHLAGIATGNVTLTAARAGYVMSPASRMVAVPPSASGQDFTAVPSTAQTNPGTVVDEARKDINMPYDAGRGCPSPFVGCGKQYHGFDNGVCTDLVLDAYNAGVPFDIHANLTADASAEKKLGRKPYRYDSARYANDMRIYFARKQQLLPNSAPYQVGDVAFFDWSPQDGIADHVLIISQVDQNGRPLKMVDQPSPKAYEHNWNSGYDKANVGHGRLTGGVSAVSRIMNTSTPSGADGPLPEQVLRISVDTPGVTLRLRDANGKERSANYDEQLVASNVDAFVPYIPYSDYSSIGATQMISVTHPLSNTDRYMAEITGATDVTYRLTVETLQDGFLTSATVHTQTIRAGALQSAPITLQQVDGILTMTADAPVPIPALATPATVNLQGLSGNVLHTTFGVTETTGQVAFAGRIVSVTDLVAQDGTIVAGSLVHVTPENFSMAAGASQVIQVTFDTSGVTPGMYQGSMILTSMNGESSRVPFSIQVVPSAPVGTPTPVSTLTPVSTPVPVATPTPVTPAPVSPTPVTPTPVTPAPAPPTPVTPAPVVLTPAPTVPGTPTPVGPTPERRNQHRVYLPLAVRP
jgi:hypothetical protein